MKIKPHAGLTRTLCMLLKISIPVATLVLLSNLYSTYSYATLPAGVDPTQMMLPAD